VPLRRLARWVLVVAMVLAVVTIILQNVGIAPQPID
jgi:hypothetical protein